MINKDVSELHLLFLQKFDSMKDCEREHFLDYLVHAKAVVVPIEAPFTEESLHKKKFSCIDEIILKASELALDFKRHCLENNIQRDTIIYGVSFDVDYILSKKAAYRYEFRPVPDITPYQLANIVAELQDPDVNIGDLPLDLRCHFNKIKVEDDE